MSSVSTPGTRTLPGHGVEPLTFIVRRRGGEYSLTRMMEELASLWPDGCTGAGWSNGSESQKSETRDFPGVRDLLATAPNPDVLGFDLTSWDTIHEAV